MDLENNKIDMTPKDILYYTIQNMDFKFLEFLIEENKFDRKKLNNNYTFKTSLDHLNTSNNLVF
jgi:hypothetical protein